MKIIPIWFHQKSWSHPQSDFSNELVSQIHMFHIISVNKTNFRLLKGKKKTVSNSMSN